MQETTLCYIEKDGQYLMLLRNKKANDLNGGKWIGVGGKLEAGETPEQCAVREIREETGLTALGLHPRGVICFNSDVWGSELMYLYTVTRFEGELTDCDEGELRWIDKSAVFDLHLWDGDRVFLRRLLMDLPPFEMTLDYQGDRLVRCLVNGREKELFDIYNEDGTPAGYVAERDFAHWRGLWHVTARIWVVRTNAEGRPELLLQLRSSRKKLHPGQYDASSAGHIAAGEDLLTGALRELEEELGLTVAAEQLAFAGAERVRFDFEADGEPYRDREHCHVFVCRGDFADDDIILQQSEVDGMMWIGYEECVRAVHDNAFPNCIDPRELEMMAPFV